MVLSKGSAVMLGMEVCIYHLGCTTLHPCCTETDLMSPWCHHLMSPPFCCSWLILATYFNQRQKVNPIVIILKPSWGINEMEEFFLSTRIFSFVSPPDILVLNRGMKDIWMTLLQSHGWSQFLAPSWASQETPALGFIPSLFHLTASTDLLVPTLEALLFTLSLHSQDRHYQQTVTQLMQDKHPSLKGACFSHWL